MKDLEKIKAALAVLIEEGRKLYTDPKYPSEGQALGEAISAVNSDSNLLLEATGEHLEDWTCSGLAKEVRDMIPRN